MFGLLKFLYMTLVALVVGASLVVVANADEERLAARAEVERATTMRR